MYPVTGKNNGFGNVFTSSDLFHSVIVDEGYTVVGRHLDPGIKKRIIEGGFVDLAKLLPKDRVMVQQEDRIEFYNNNGRPCFRMVTDGSENITNFH